MRVLICGIDGYIGWSLALHLTSLGHEVHGIDNFSRRKNVKEVGSWSAIPIKPMKGRLESAKRHIGAGITFRKADMLDFDSLRAVVSRVSPDAIVHLAEQPSAPFSMIGRRHATYTQENNVIGTLNLLYAIKETAPNAHLVKLGTLGEYGTPKMDIPEGFFEVTYHGRKARLPFPRQAGSIYHLSKVHDSANIFFACGVWGLRSTDIMQGVVYGVKTPDMVDDSLATRFDFDEAFGTVVNRYCAQAVINYPLTTYGIGGQTRGFIALTDSIKCLTLVVEHPPEKGEYRVLNQFNKTYSVKELAHKVKEAGERVGIHVPLGRIEDPRVELQEHYYHVEGEGLRRMGFVPTRPIEDELEEILAVLSKYKSRLEAKSGVIAPTIKWRGSRKD